MWKSCSLQYWINNKPQFSYFLLFFLKLSTFFTVCRVYVNLQPTLAALLVYLWPLSPPYRSDDAENNCGKESKMSQARSEPASPTQAPGVNTSEPLCPSLGLLWKVGNTNTKYLEKITVWFPCTLFQRALMCDGIRATTVNPGNASLLASVCWALVKVLGGLWH